MTGRIPFPAPVRATPTDLRWESPVNVPVVSVDEQVLVSRMIARRFGDTDDARLVLDALAVSA